MSVKLTIMQRYDALPEWLRWIICWPMSLVIAVAVWWLVATGALSAGAYAFIIRLSHPVVVQVSFLVAIYYTVPRAKLGIVLTFIILRTFFLVFFLVFTPLLLFGVLPQEEVPMNWEDWWGPFLGEVLTLAASVSIYKAAREGQ